MRELYRDAILVQDACNLSGVVHAFSRAMTKLRELYPAKSTEWYNTHPIAVMYSSKIASLTGSEDEPTLTRAYAECKEQSTL